MKVLRKNDFTKVFGISIIIVFLFLVFGAARPKVLADYANKAFTFTSTYFGGFYLLVTVFFIVFILFLAFSRFGKVKLGSNEDEPDYTYYNWIGMLFSAGFGISLVFWGVSEPVKHYLSPPGDVPSKTVESAKLAMQYSMFHWGIHQWAIFAVIGLAIAYVQFRKNKQGLISAVLEPIIPLKLRDTPWYSVVDVLAVIATATGVATSLGLGVMQINGGLNYLFHIKDNIMTQLIIILVLLGMYLFSSITGLNKGIRILSLINLSIAFLLMGFAFITGPTFHIMKTFISGLGDYLDNSIKMSVNIEAFADNQWINDWTVFYWAWAIAWSPFVGTFIARVSKGRTIREFVLGVLFVPALVAIAWMAVFGGSALYFEIAESYPIASVVEKDIAKALFVTLNHFPLGFWISLIAILLIFTFLITSADSATFVLGMMTSKDKLNPSLLIKIIWGVFQAGIAGVLLISSGLKGLQTASLITALPFSIIMILMCFSLYKMLKEEVKYNKF